MLPRDHTSQENIIEGYLSEWGLRYEMQASFPPYTVDFFIPELNMVIEADGTLTTTENSESDVIAKGVSYTETIPVLLKAIQEQQTLIEALTARIIALEG